MRNILISLYRLSAIIIVAAPIALNVYLQGAIINSLIYTPLISLVLAGIAIYFDDKLVTELECLQAKNKVQKVHAQKHALFANPLKIKMMKLKLCYFCFH